MTHGSLWVIVIPDWNISPVRQHPDIPFVCAHKECVTEFMLFLLIGPLFLKYIITMLNHWLTAWVFLVKLSWYECDRTLLNISQWFCVNGLVPSGKVQFNLKNALMITNDTTKNSSIPPSNWVTLSYLWEKIVLYYEMFYSGLMEVTWVFLGRQCAFAFPFMFENTENKQLIDG